MRGWWTALVVLSGCQLFAGGRGVDEPPATECPPPGDPALLGIAPDLRNTVIDAAGRGVVAVRYQTDACSAELDVESDCRVGATYVYAPAPD